MTNIQKLVELFKKVAALNDDTDGRAFETAVGLKLAEMAKNDEEIIAAVSGDALEAPDGGFNMQLVIAPHEGKNYFMVFPDTSSAAAVKTGYTMCRLRELLQLIKNTPQMSGMQLIFDADAETGKFSSGEINRTMVLFAAELAEK